MALHEQSVGETDDLPLRRVIGWNAPVPTRDEIATAIREGFEAPPEDWPERKPWADGALNIADEILRMFGVVEVKDVKLGLEGSIGEIYEG